MTPTSRRDEPTVRPEAGCSDPALPAEVAADPSAAAERVRLGKILDDAERSRALWVAVIEKAAQDLGLLFGLQAKTRLKRHERARLQAILENHPVDFFRSGRFGAICSLLGVSERTMRRYLGVDDLLTDLDAA